MKHAQNSLFITASVFLSGGATYFVFEVNCFRFCQIKFVCIDVAMCDPVHDVETVFRLC